MGVFGLIFSEVPSGGAWLEPLAVGAWGNEAERDWKRQRTSYTPQRHTPVTSLSTKPAAQHQVSRTPQKSATPTVCDTGACGNIAFSDRTRAFTGWWASHRLDLETLGCTHSFAGMFSTLARKLSSSDHLEEPPAEASLS